MDPIEATDYRDLIRVSDPRLSPAGDRVAFVRTVPDDATSYESTVHLVDVATPDSDGQRFTAGPEDSQPRWGPAGDRLAFRRADDGLPQLHVLPVDGGESRQVTDVAGGVDDVTWSPNGTQIAFTQRARPDERADGHDLSTPDEYEREDPDPRIVDRTVYRAHEQYFDGGWSHVYVVDLTDETVERVTSGEHDHVSPEWGDETTLYYALKRGKDPDDTVKYDIDALDTTTGETETITTTQGWQVTLAASEDGRLAYPYTPEPVSLRQTELELYDPATAKTTRPTESFDRTVALDGGLSWADGCVHFLAPDEGAYTICRANADGIEQLVTKGHTSGVTASEDGVAFVRSDWDHWGDVFIHGEGETRRLTQVNANYLATHRVFEPQPVMFESDGYEVQGWLLTPEQADPEERFPLVVEVHGGPHAMWTTSGTMWHEFQTLAARGYAVFWCNPRGSTGYGEAFATAIERDWGAVTAADVLAGVEAACEHEVVDGTEIHLSGGSFGGFMTAWLVTRHDRFRSAVAQRGVYELPSFYGTTDAFKLIEGDFGAVPWDMPDFLWEQSPVAEADDVTTPTLLLHAENDYRVPVSQAEVFFRFLKKGRVETRLVRYPRDGHELSRSGDPGHVIDRLERISRWFDGYSDYRDVPKALDRGDDGLSEWADRDEE